MLKNRFRSVAGWERVGSETLLRVNLAEPELTEVWPGNAGAETPAGEMRTLRDKVIPLSDVYLAVQDSYFAESEGYGPGDVALMKEALEESPRRTAQRKSGGQGAKAKQPGIGMSMGI